MRLIGLLNLSSIGAGVGGMISQSSSFEFTGNRREESHKKLCAPDELFGLLDELLLLNILEKLQAKWDRSAWCLVCKRFLAVEASSRKKLELFDAKVLENALSRYTDIQELDLSPCFLVDDATLETVGKLSGRYLRTLSLFAFDDTDHRTLGRLPEQGLRGRNLANFRRFSEPGLLSLVKFCPQLQHLDLSYCSQIADRGIIAVAQLTKLESLKLVNCRNITDAGLGCIAAGCKNLRSLSLKRCLGISDIGISWVSANCKQLERLDLSHTKLSTIGLASITDMQKLQKLRLVSCNSVDDTGLALLQKNCKSLLILDVRRCKNVSDGGIMALATGSVYLQQLCLSHCPLITGTLFARFEKFQSLQIIKLDGCHNATSGLTFIGHYCKSLKTFSVRRCEGVTDAGICAVAKGCRDLEDLDLTGCNDLTDLAVASIAASCKGLRSLKLRACELITDTGFALLGNNCTALEVLNLSYCSIGDGGLKSLSRCTALKILKLADCIEITEEGILYIAASCLDLTHVDLCGSDGVGQDGINALSSSCPKLESIKLEKTPVWV